MDRHELMLLQALPGVGIRSILRLAAAHPGPLAPWDPAGWLRRRWVTRRGAESLADPARVAAAAGRARAWAAACATAGWGITGWGEPAYPPLLTALPDPPPLLYTAGRWPVPAPAVAVVGTRQPTAFGLAVARRVAAFLARHGVAVVSGLAWGVDAAAHRACLAAGGITVAVLPGGLDLVYPRRHRPLAAAILAGGGTWVTEQPPGTAAHPAALVLRDRIQAGLSQAVVVCESGAGGGALHAARTALRLGRPVYVPVPRNPAVQEAPGYAGLARLLAEGARPLRSDRLRDLLP